jgi:ERCC4-type nuclease
MSNYRFVIDNRENKLCEYFKEFPNIYIEQLDLGDIIFENEGTIRYIIERKSVNDLYSSIKDGRYREQKKRLLSNFKPEQIIYLIEGSIPYNNAAAYYGSVVNMIMRDKIHIFQSKNMNESIKFLKTIEKRFIDNVDFLQEGGSKQEVTNTEEDYAETVKIKKKDNLTPYIFQIIMLAQIPGT